MKSNYKRLGDYIHKVDERNDEYNTNLLGLSMTKEYRASTSNIVGTDLSSYKVMRKNRFVCDFMSVIRVYKLPVVLHKRDDIAIVSPAYTTFEVNNSEILLPEYLMLWFRRPEFDRYAFFKCDSAIRGGFDWDTLCDCMLPIPSIEDQQKIVDAYETIEKRIAIKKKINENLEKQALVNYQKITQKECEIGKIGDYCDVKSGYAFKSEWWINDGYKVIKIANIVDGSIDLDNCDCVSEENARKSSLFYVRSGDVLIAMTGATTGKIGIVPYSRENITVNQRVGKFFLGSQPIEKLAFLVCTLLSRGVKEKLQPDGTAGSAQDNLSADDIKNIEIKLPHRNEIEQFNKLYEKFFKIIIENNAEIRRLNKLLSVLLQTISVVK